MPPRPATPCSRAFQRQLVVPLGAIWVSDALLARVFERYSAASHIRRRMASSTPGPLESRRRLGKRRIGDLNIGHAPSSLPDWALPNAPDLSKWKWEPPTMLSVREAKLKAQRRLANHWLLRWLIPGVRDGPTQVEAPKPFTLLELLDQFQSRVSTESVPDLIRACDDLCLQLRAGREPFNDKELLVKSLDGVREALGARFGTSSDEFSFYIQLYAALVEGMFRTPGESLPLESDSPFSVDLFQGLLDQLNYLPAGDELCNLFELTMRHIPPPKFYDRLAHIEHIISKFLLSWSDNAWDGQVSEEHISAIASALARWSPSEAGSLFTAAEQLLLGRSGSSEVLYNARYAWLSVLARLPRFGDNALSDSISTLFFSDDELTVRLSSIDLCDLLLQHWSTSGKIRNSGDVRDLCEQVASSGESMYVASLSYALFRLEKNWQHRIPEVVNVLRRTGRVSELVTSFLELRRQQLVHRRLLRKVALECDDYRVALQLFRLCRGQRTDGKVWAERTWPKYLEQATSDPSTPLSTVFSILRLCRPSQRTVNLAADLAYEIAHSSDTPQRTALLRVTQCITMIRRGGYRLPVRALTALWRVVTSDLAAGQLGRTKRLEWYVALVERECGPEQSHMAAEMLSLWREMVHHVNTRGAVEGVKAVRERKGAVEGVKAVRERKGARKGAVEGVKAVRERQTVAVRRTKPRPSSR